MIWLQKSVLYLFGQEADLGMDDNQSVYIHTNLLDPYKYAK